MNLMEEKGRTLLLEVIGVLLILTTISIFIEQNVISLFLLIVNGFLWALMYRGYFVAKIATIIWLLSSVVTGIILIFEGPPTLGVTFWLMIQVAIYLGASTILIFSKSISAYMAYKVY